MAPQNIIQRLLIMIRKSFRATAVLAWVFELITLTMELLGDNTGRFDKFSAIFSNHGQLLLHLMGCPRTSNLKTETWHLAAVGTAISGLYMKMGNQVGRPTLYATNFAPLSLSYAHFGVAVLDFVYRGHGSTYVFALVAFVLATLALIPTQAYHPWFPASQLPPQQAETTVEPYATAETARQLENDAVEVENPVLASLSSPAQSMDKLESEIHCLQSRLGLLR